MKKSLLIMSIIVVIFSIGAYTAEENDVQVEIHDQHLFLDGMMVEDMTIEKIDTTMYIKNQRHIRVTTGNGYIVWKRH